MAVLAGAILTFGRDQLGTTIAALLACTPLLVWFWATYEPLNRYGDRVETRLSQIETKVNDLFGVELNHYTEFKKPWLLSMRHAVPVACLVALLFWALRLGAKGRYGIRVFAVALHCAFVILLWESVSAATVTVEPTGRLNITKNCLQVVAQGDPQSLSLLLQEIARVQCNQGRSNWWNGLAGMNGITWNPALSATTKSRSCFNA